MYLGVTITVDTFLRLFKAEADRLLDILAIAHRLNYLMRYRQNHSIILGIRLI